MKALKLTCWEPQYGNNRPTFLFHEIYAVNPLTSRVPQRIN